MPAFSAALGRLVLFAALFSLAIMAAACSDDATSPADGAVAADTGAKKDGKPTSDQGTPSKDKGKPTPDMAKPTPDMAKPMPDKGKPTPDMAKPVPDKGSSKLNCSQIGACSDTCAAACPAGLAKVACMIKCSNDCKAKGCTKAKAVYGTLYSCINLKCGLACLGGPTKSCKSCVTSKCTTQEKACSAQKC